MRVATWNVNSLRVRLPQVLAWLAAEAPDVLALQETKVPDEAFPALEFREAGYHVVFAGEKTYNGVAIVSRLPPAEVADALPGAPDGQRRYLAATCGPLRVIDVYVPNGQAVGSDKFAYKLAWMEALAAQVRAELARHPLLVVLGDFNVAPEDRDVHDPELWRERVLASTPEREAFRALLEAGLCDVLRRITGEAGIHTWWDYRMNAYRRGMGLRIDHVLASPALCGRVRACRVDRAPREGERPSDHAPVVAEFDLAGS
ncbi:exodeoxyribonuclease III [Inmirania thermothiophila]|uniref:Exodeoxyribonuclease III n=1 Tax=Inmirania thermothiophila TaxID=1750597 RepID=A0A3N1Y6I8_9GAMM|nr:exodeoxyribonuclease III [Inmirania thermothiophila]ROR34370.1 exodeoxyribonuclease III [Inmirania thermothiophila]